MVVDLILTWGMISFAGAGGNTKRGVEFRHLARNVLKVGRHVGRSVLSLVPYVYSYYIWDVALKQK